MISKKVEIGVGMFVALALASLLMMALKVADQGMSGSDETYRLYAKFDNIGGLKPRSAVKVGGVIIGRVGDIHLDKNDFIPVVTLVINDEYQDFPDTSSVSILTSGLLGEQYVGFEPGFSFDGVASLQDEDFIADTKSALVLEDLIGQFLFSRDSDE